MPAGNQRPRPSKRTKQREANRIAAGKPRTVCHYQGRVRPKAMTQRELYFGDIQPWEHRTLTNMTEYKVRREAKLRRY